MTVGIAFEQYTIGDDVGCILGEVAVTTGVGGSVTDAILATGTPFWLLLTGSTQGSGATQKNVSFAGSTMTWDGNGPSGTLVYGVMNPNFPAPAAGTADFSVIYKTGKRLTRAMAQLCCVTVANITGTGAVQTLTISHPAGYPPVLAIHSLLGYTCVFNAAVGSTSTTYTFIAQAGTSIWYYVFTKVPDSTPSGQGMRLFNDAGKVMFDSRYKMADIVATNLHYSTSDWAPPTNPSETLMYTGTSGRKYAAITCDAGFSFYTPGPGPLTADLSGVGTRNYANELIYMKGLKYGGTPGVVGAFDTRVPATFAAIDVTGL